jgi:lysyl-tRNA synthetase class 2
MMMTDHADDDLHQERVKKLTQWRTEGQSYPNDFEVKDRALDLHKAYAKCQTFEETSLIQLAGRIRLKRVMGKASFVTLQDGTGQMQVYVSLGDLGEAHYGAFKHWDLGDVVGVIGRLFRTKMGELTIHASEIRLLVKCLRPLPEKFYGLSDQEQKYRQRYLDLMMNETSREVFIRRSQVIQKIREFLVARDFLEVETPMMHPIPGGASARPFMTHHNALDRDLFLRVAPELYLKRLLVGGFERVFEINRNFRNEGLSPRHNPEFTMIEFYEAYRDYRYLMELTEQMLRDVAQTVLGTQTFPYGDGVVDFSQPFRRWTLQQALQQKHPEYGNAPLENLEFLRQELARLKIKTDGSETVGILQLKLFEETTESLLFEPTFIIDYPAETSPLARRSDKNPEVTERFELFVAGRELANGFSELNDPEDQSCRFQEQVRQKEAGDAEAMHYDADYIRALEYGMPPAAGEGIGIDRLVMLLTNTHTIRDVILFPQLRA